MSDLTTIKGIGPATVAKLNELGINDLAGLASQDDPSALAELIGGRGLTAEIVAGWIAEAKGEPADSEPTTSPEPFGAKVDHNGDVKPGGAAAHLIPVRVNRDFWDENGERHRKGTVVEVPVNEALDGVESGALSRVK